MSRIRKKKVQESKDEEDEFKMFSSSEDEDEDGKLSQSRSALSDLSDILSTSQASLWEESDLGPVLKNTDDAVFRRPVLKLNKKQLEEEDKRRRRDSVKILQAMNKSHEYNKSKNASSNNPQLQLQQEDLRKLYSTALQLFGNKRITKDNAFSLKLLDCFGSLVKKDLNTDDINTVARALEACTRIFSCRVDLAHSTLRRISNDIIHKNVGNSDEQVDSSANHKDDKEGGDEQANNDDHGRQNKADAEEEYIPFDIDLNDPNSYCGFDENGDEIMENDDENKEGGQNEQKAGTKKKKVLPGCIETDEYNLSLESEVSKDTESHALKKFKAQFHDSIKTRKPDDFFFQYEKLVPSYTARLEDPDALREERANLLAPVSFPKTLALTDDLVDLQFYDLNLDIDFDPTIHNIWGYERRDSDDEGNASSIATKNATVIENEADDLEDPNLLYNPNDRPAEYPESPVGAPEIADSGSEGDEAMMTNEIEEIDEQEGVGVSIANLNNLDQLEAYFNKIRATKDKKVDIFRIFANNLTSSRQKVNKPNENKDKSIVAPQPLTIKELSIFSNKYKSYWKNNLSLNVINKEEWGNFDSIVPIGSYQEMNDLEFPQYAELSKSIETVKRKGKLFQIKDGQSSNTNEHYRYFMDRDRNILEIMKKHPKGYKNINQIKEFLQEEKVEEENANNANSVHEAEHFDGFEPDDDGDFEGFEGGIRNKDEYCYDNPWVFGDFPEKNARLMFDRKSGGFVDLANLDSECFEEGNEFTTAHSDIMNIMKPAVDMHFLKTVIEGILKKRFDKNSPLKNDDYTFDELLIDIWKGNYLENAHDNVSPSMTLASFLHVCTDCGFSLERVVVDDCGESGVANDEEKENILNPGEDASNASENEPKMEREILYIRPPQDVDFAPSSF